MNTVRKKLEKINISGSICFDEPMALHTTFRVGGPADIFITPSGIDDLKLILPWAQRENLPIFPLGAGANILVSDRGIRGLVINLSGLNEMTLHGEVLVAGAGVEINKLVEKAADASLSGLEFIYGMPGSVGGSVWMNARCYGISLSDILKWVENLDPDGRITRYEKREEDFSYKRSPFQGSRSIILRSAFLLQKGSPEKIRKEMEAHRSDRKRKGHYLAPCAGSVFKNNRDFGEPSGKIIDSLGLKGYQIGGARVADFHGNIIINNGNAQAADIRNLIEFIQKEVFESRGFMLEPEVLYAGEWSDKYC